MTDEGYTPTESAMRAMYVRFETVDAKLRGRFDVADLATYHAEFDRFIAAMKSGDTE